mmetsp:Transcript_46795/g.110988  ORF Transcript_46795/g.110988 Transcript_46795/m.110988 type:complete len:278 (+) Transcript_46795:1074-1907(+)
MRPPRSRTSSMIDIALMWSIPGSSPTSFISVHPAVLARSCSPRMPSETYDAVTRCVRCLTHSSATGTCIPAGSSDTTTSAPPTSASNSPCCPRTSNCRPLPLRASAAHASASALIALATTTVLPSSRPRNSTRLAATLPAPRTTTRCPAPDCTRTLPPPAPPCSLAPAFMPPCPTTTIEASADSSACTSSWIFPTIVSRTAWSPWASIRMIAEVLLCGWTRHSTMEKWPPLLSMQSKTLLISPESKRCPWRRISAPTCDGPSTPSLNRCCISPAMYS